jgi:hypothetical protein
MESYEDLFINWCIENDERVGDLNIIFEKYSAPVLTFTIEDKKVKLTLESGSTYP